MLAEALPAPVREDLTREVGAIDAVQHVSGGSFGPCLRVEITGAPFFLKLGNGVPAGFFATEASGLETLRAIGSPLRVPRLAASRDAPDGWSWILLEWLEHRQPSKRDWGTLGEGLAELHLAGGGSWGAERDGFIGRLPQSNAAAASWAEFWSFRRLRPQLALATPVGSIGESSEWELLLSALPRILAPAEDDGASTLHGDLWSGNVVFTPAGPSIVDPACYGGHREVDLAMADLFGGFDPAFFAAYEATWPFSPGYQVRRSIYQLYYLLVHVNLFGAGYASETRSTLRKALACI